ncbi:apolipoprotein N-acyltransferase [Roseiconus lacunae]|uniref:apolipoprotein N-acyltransferase n=1 Tax=Roseiconus lacunae TaxID=2605694 RepID=UPI003093B4F6|nr:apolipoprotein N-acyltransferase [Stieleria sp. HD01]
MGTNEKTTEDRSISRIGRLAWGTIVAAMLLRWLAQPPLAVWPLVFVAVVPLLMFAKTALLTRRHLLALFFVATAYWAGSLQGLRHANPLLYPCWVVLSAYLASYSVLFVILVRRSDRWRCPVWIAAPVLWVGLECLRNYFLTGISVLMLGHSLANVPELIQIADLAGTYAVSFMIVIVNAAVFQTITWYRQRTTPQQTDYQSAEHRQLIVAWVLAVTVVLSTIGYGRYRLNQPTRSSDTVIALIGRNEPIEYVQTKERELEIFQGYLQQSIRATQATEDAIDAIVWPESMMTGSLPWVIGDGNAEQARLHGVPMSEVTAWLQQQRQRYLFRAANVLRLLAEANGPTRSPPHLIGGNAVLDYSGTPRGYSGLVHLTPDAQVDQWYGKMHLVMFGEYIPLVKSIPWVREFVPPGMGIDRGDGPKVFRVNDLTLNANICIETAVERVSINHFRELRNQHQPLPDSIVTVTNDGWFDDSSVIEHHKRCAQLLAVACRRPILSSANNGPTVWIDSTGQVVEELPRGSEGHVLANPQIDDRTSLVVLIGDWPARICAGLAILAASWRRRESA